ncbi:MAG TPA: ATP-binding protein [Bryobacteraceae bacterium]|nr:ATP-binding protein [Bryobacteraceae bacterium]
MVRTNDALLWKGLIGLFILTVAVLHRIVPISERHTHNMLYHIDILPILAAAMLFGWRGAAGASLLAAFLETPQIAILWGAERVYAMDQIGELSVFGMAGLVAGSLADRERGQRSKLEQTKRELERVYQELQQNLERLRKAERLYAAGQLSASLAHEIRNPLLSISGAAGILKRGHASIENFQECLEIIDKESQRLNKLLTNFLDFARPRAPRFQRTDLVAVIDSVVVLAGHAPGAGSVELQRRVEEMLPEIECDPEQLKQVLLNLLINAIQASEGAGQVEITARSEPGRIRIAVRDQGCGIPPEQRDRIFDPFFTTKENGTGLGLAIASKIVEQHGGILAADDNPDRGMTLRVELPLDRNHPL